MKGSNGERAAARVLARLGELDGAMLADAYGVGKTERTVMRSRPWRFAWVSGVAALLLLLIALGLIVPLASPKGPPTYLAFDDAEGAADSIDCLNYYAARMALSAAEDGAYAGLHLHPRSIAPLSAESGGNVLDDAFGEDLILYGIGRDEEFSVTRTVLFRAVLKNESGFLASRLGTGEIEVVLTENSLEPMVTFRRGNRFYSCLLNGTTEDSVIFSTHKYVEGFSLVKNFEASSFTFEISFEGGYATDVVCRYFKSGDLFPLYAEDEVEVLHGSTYVSERSYTLTAEALSAYFGGGLIEKPPLAERDVVARLVGDAHTMIFYGDGSFDMCSASTSELYRTGRYRVYDNEKISGLLLIFCRLDGVAVSSVFLPDGSLDGLTLDGEAFVRAKGP